MSEDCRCPKEKYKQFTPKPRGQLEEEKQKETSPQPEPTKERKKSWWDKLKDRLDPGGIGGLPMPDFGMI